MVFKSLLDEWKIIALRKIFVLPENLHSCGKSAVVENLYTSWKPPYSWKVCEVYKLVVSYVEGFINVKYCKCYCECYLKNKYFFTLPSV